ncbi:fumarylacetoacetate hydrolase family protein [Paenibacillus senegalensis]|uniref:fumarylacetoacetate hydrolase family protein n=1 Tax=Paenibacillus senegalensis TaxID=1465766 RepID=UPI000287AECC|nr:fumarylacetoacetate hydrolase family protein [Paenibacillus senegalensis]
MKLVTFQPDGSRAALFGAILESGFAISFSAIMQKRNRHTDRLDSMDAYLHHLPESEGEAREMLRYAAENEDQFTAHERFPLPEVRLLPPIPNIPALLDFGLSPRHLQNAAYRIIQREVKPPLRGLLQGIVRRKLQREYKQPNFRYYKCNHNAIIGDGDTINWPSFTSYLDIEPELGIVLGKDSRIAGYVIFNDCSARDVQLPDFLSLTGPARCKDFDHSKGIGPYLVTPDEAGDPLDLKVEVKIGERLRWKGSTSEYTAPPEKIVKELCSIFQPLPGTVLGMGTIPDCCAIETEEWLLPSDKIEITFDKLGTLTQFVPDHIEIREQSRWRTREDLPVLSSGRVLPEQPSACLPYE